MNTEREILSFEQGDLVETQNPSIMCSALPPHWRSNKILPTPFTVVSLDPEIEDGTKVFISAGNGDNFCPEIKNNTAVMRNGKAKFDDLRFIGRSGRGKTFMVIITIASKPCQIATINNAIKVTVDGPREPRCKTNSQFGPPMAWMQGPYDPIAMYPSLATADCRSQYGCPSLYPNYELPNMLPLGRYPEIPRSNGAVIPQVLPPFLHQDYLSTSALQSRYPQRSSMPPIHPIPLPHYRRCSESSSLMSSPERNSSTISSPERVDVVPALGEDINHPEFSSPFSVRELTKNTLKAELNISKPNVWRPY